MSERAKEAAAMREHLMRCPVCGDRMTVDARTRLVDCPQRHHATTEPSRWREASVRMMLDDLEAYRSPADDVTNHEHRWITIENTRHESLEECVLCAAWRMAPPQPPHPRTSS
jgi:hypothetical protein